MHSQVQREPLLKACRRGWYNISMNSSDVLYKPSVPIHEPNELPVNLAMELSEDLPEKQSLHWVPMKHPSYTSEKRRSQS